MHKKTNYINYLLTPVQNTISDALYCL